MDSKIANARVKIVEETRTVFLVSAYFIFLLGSFTLYRQLILAEYKVDYFHFGFNIIEALVLAKVIILGRMLHLGERFDDRPLIIPTIYKTVSFSFLVLVFTTLEHLLSGLWHGHGLQEVIGKIVAEGIWEILARVLVLLVALVPLFACWETGRVLGEGKLLQLFFKGGQANVQVESRLDQGNEPPSPKPDA